MKWWSYEVVVLCKLATLGTSESGLILEGWPHFRGEFVLKSMLWDFSKWPEYRGGHISGVLIRGVPLYVCVISSI